MAIEDTETTEMSLTEMVKLLLANKRKNEQEQLRLAEEQQRR